MDTIEKLSLIENCMDIELGTLKEQDLLADYEEWDSLTALSVIAIVSEKYNIMLTGEELKRVKTVSELLELIN